MSCREQPEGIQVQHYRLSEVDKSTARQPRVVECEVLANCEVLQLDPSPSRFWQGPLGHLTAFLPGKLGIVFRYATVIQVSLKQPKVSLDGLLGRACQGRVVASGVKAYGKNFE